MTKLKLLWKMERRSRMSLMLLSNFSQGWVVAQYYLKIYSHSQGKRKEQLGEDSHAFFWANESREIKKCKQVVKDPSDTSGRRHPCWKFLSVSYGLQDLAVELGVIFLLEIQQ